MNSKFSFTRRAQTSPSLMGQRLLKLLDDKKTNLALSLDVLDAHALLNLADQLGPEICILKTHIDMIQDFTSSLLSDLKYLAHKHQFLLFEDRKFADIGHTVKHQLAGGLYRIADWADIVNAHTLPGPHIVKGLQEAVKDKACGLLLIAEMSSKGHLMNNDYQQQTLRIAEEHPDFVFGFITQHALSCDPHWINLTPGIKLNISQDDLGQQYRTPHTAILEHGADIIIVGRGILEDQHRLQMAKAYRKAGWDAYLARLSQ